MLKETFIKDEEKGPIPATVSNLEKGEIKTEVPEKPVPDGVMRKIEVMESPVAATQGDDGGGKKRGRESAIYVPSGFTLDTKFHHAESMH